jgi:hypothetical protein
MHAVEDSARRYFPARSVKITLLDMSCPPTLSARIVTGVAHRQLRCPVAADEA